MLLRGNAHAAVFHAKTAGGQHQVHKASLGVMQGIAQQVSHDCVEQNRVVEARIRPLLAALKVQALFSEQRSPAIGLFRRHICQAAVRHKGTGVGFIARQLQEGLHQVAHFFAGPADALNLLALTRRQMAFGQQFAGGGNDHQGSAQFVADITGEQPLALQRLAHLAQGAVEGRRQLTHFIVGVFGGQWWRQHMQLVAVAHLLCQPTHRGHDLSSHDQPKPPSTDHGEQKTR